MNINLRLLTMMSITLRLHDQLQHPLAFKNIAHMISRDPMIYCMFTGPNVVIMSQPNITADNIFANGLNYHEPIYLNKLIDLDLRDL